MNDVIEPLLCEFLNRIRDTGSPVGSQDGD
jgi:hypothetical protein